MDPVLGGEVVEGRQLGLVLGDLLGRLGKLRAAELGERLDLLDGRRLYGRLDLKVVPTSPVIGCQSMKSAFPWLDVRLTRRQFPGAVSVEPCCSPALGVLLVDRLSPLVQFKDVCEDREGNLHLGRRLP
ncbi:hypothetical protein ACGFZB_25300 [Streptomyces cinerochromogenes]|uniref:Uncharacterized protein n=1 Tax=Streptomyces cinerochromogenes TaxID=66422 RepID=A0ABW7BD62_9ACTN